MTEPLTPEELERSRDILTRFPDFRENPVLARWMVTIDALTERAETAERERDRAEAECIDFMQRIAIAIAPDDEIEALPTEDMLVAHVIAAEATAARYREALEQIVTALEISDQRVPHTPAHDDAMDDVWDLRPVARDALASLAPVADERTTE